MCIYRRCPSFRDDTSQCGIQQLNKCRLSQRLLNVWAYEVQRQKEKEENIATVEYRDDAIIGRIKDAMLLSILL